MNKNDAEKMLRDAQSDLAKVRKEFDALQGVVTGLEQWLSLSSPSSAPAPGVLPLFEKPSLRKAILDVLRNSDDPLHVKVIHDRVTELGAVTTAKNPLGIIDLTILGFIKGGEVKKIAPRTYQAVK